LQRQKEFFYCVHIAAPEKKKKKWSLFGLRQIYYKKLSLFFGFVKFNKFINLYNKIKKIKNNAEYFFYLFLESRLETFLLRINFLPSIYFIKRFILSGNIFVNNKKIIYHNFILKPNNILSIQKNKFFDVYKSLKFNLKRKNIFINSPKYIEVDYKLLMAMLVRKPTYNELTHPMSFELYTSFLTISK
jgi:ribosomal protein S4